MAEGGWTGKVGELLGRIVVESSEVEQLARAGVPMGAPMQVGPGFGPQKPMYITPDPRFRDMLKPLAALAAIGIGVAAMVRNSQILNTMTSLFSQTMGAILDMFLIPLMPVFLRIEKWLLSLLGVSQQIGKALGTMGGVGLAGMGAMAAPFIFGQFLKGPLGKMGVPPVVLAGMGRYLGAGGVAAAGFMAGEVGYRAAADKGQRGWGEAGRVGAWGAGGAIAGTMIAPGIGTAVGFAAGTTAAAIANILQARQGRELLTEHSQDILQQLQRRGGLLPHEALAQGRGNVNVTNTTNIYVSAPGGPVDIAQEIARVQKQEAVYEPWSKLGSSGTR